MALKTAKELQDNLLTFSTSYFLTDIRKDKESYYALSAEELEKYWVCIGGYILNVILDGNLDKASELINLLPDSSIIKTGLTIVNPAVGCSEFIKRLKLLKESKQSLGMVVLTAGRPYVLNGFNDFSRLGLFFKKHRELITEYIGYLYGTDCENTIYNLSLAEYYYQNNNLIDSELLVSRTIKEFDKKNEFRFLFCALFLEAKIALANGTILKSSSYIKDIKQRVTKIGKAEFSNNIDAAEVELSLYSGDYELISNWMKTDAPDEIGDFCMLDLYRYMVKIRCYIVQEEFSTALSLIEKLRPQLEMGRRHMDLCEIDLLMAETLWSANKKEEAFEALKRALKISKRRNYLRLVADEGIAIFNILVEYIKENGETPFLKSITEMTRRVAILYPLYLKPRVKNKENFTQQEVDFICLLEQGKSYDEIADYFFITVNTVKYHVKKIYSKLGVENANQAVWKAKVLGLIK